MGSAVIVTVFLFVLLYTKLVGASISSRGEYLEETIERFGVDYGVEKVKIKYKNIRNTSINQGCSYSCLYQPALTLRRFNPWFRPGTSVQIAVGISSLSDIFSCCFLFQPSPQSDDGLMALGLLASD